MHRHDAHALGAFLDNRRLARLVALGARFKLIDERAKRRGPAARLVTPRLVHDSHDIRERLLAGRPNREPRMRARRQPAASRSSRRSAVDSVRDADRLITSSAPFTSLRLSGKSSGSLRNGCRLPSVMRNSSSAASDSANTGPCKRSEHRQLVIGPLDRAEQIAHRDHFFALVERSALDQHMRQMPRFERAQVRPRHVAAERIHAAKQDADMARANRHAHVGRLALGHRPSAFMNQPSRVRGDRFGNRLVDFPVDDAAEIAVRLGHRQHDDRRLRREIGAKRHERRIRRLRAGLLAHQRRERSIDHRLNLPASRESLPSDARVGRHASAAVA